VSPASGSPTRTGWKRRSSAASFSTCLRYSSSVVAPTARSSPRASIGFSRLAASTAPSAAPAPTIVCSSSRKRTIWPSACRTSASTAFNRSSNSPLYLEPASSEPMSSAITRRSRRLSGTSPLTIRCARPSTIAVLPTPGSPINTGLFLVRRESTWITRRISSSRPITGSTLPRAASAVRSRPNFSSAWTLSSGLGEVTLCGPRTSAIAFSREARSGRMPAMAESPSASASSRCSVEMYSSPSLAISRSAPRRAAARFEENRGSSPSPSVGSSSTFWWASAPIAAGSDPTFCRIGTIRPSSWTSNATSRCAGVTSGLRLATASCCAAATASWDFTVNRSACISFPSSRRRLPAPRAAVAPRAAPCSASPPALQAPAPSRRRPG
jgi:hypothetical protein